MTGVGLALVMGVKMVGLFTVATIGLATLVDLFRLLDIKRGHSMTTIGKHFSARVICLVILPVVLYLIPFYIHFALLQLSGPGDAFMSLNFQSHLIGNNKTTGSTNIPMYAKVSLQHVDTSHYLHSHVHKYPLRYDDGRVSSEGQQVNGYAHSDNNSIWSIIPAVISAKEAEVGYGSSFRLQHVNTGAFLVTHDVASPLTKTNMEVTCIEGESAEERFNETIWRIYDDGDGGKIKSKRDSFILINDKHNVALYTSKDLLPDWGFKMQETNGNKKTTENNNKWTFQTVMHESLIVENDTVIEDKGAKMTFLAKFFELQGLMIHHNNALTKSHPYSSAPITWPFVIRGISFWETKEGLKQIYLIGNPVAWWLAISGPFLYASIWGIDRLFLQRGIDDFGPAVRNWYNRSIGFLLLAWFMHFAPFFLMGRMLFLHHYMPAYIFSVIVTTALIDFLFRDFLTPLHVHRGPMMKWRGETTVVYFIFVFIVGGMVLAGFAYFAPLCYGLGFPDLETLRSHKW